MTTKKAPVEEIKQPKTIKVSTVVISVTFLALLLASFIGGWTMRSVDQSRIQSEARALTDALKAEK